MAPIYHMVHYRKFELSTEAGITDTLESLLRKTLTVADTEGTTLWERAEDRVFKLNDQHEGQILLNKVADLNSSVFGELCFVETKGLQALLQRTASKQKLSDLTTAEIFGLEERHAPTGSHFIRGLAYWLAIGNHLFFVKMQSMTPARIQEYLDWLLRSTGTALPPGVSFALQAEFDKAVGDIGDIRKLRVSGRRAPLAVEVATQGDEKRETQTRRRVKEAELKSEQARPIWEAILGATRTESFLAALGPGEYITADAALSVRGRRTAEARKKIKEVANELADVVDAKVQIEGSDGRISDGDAILRTRMPFIPANEGSTLLEFDNVADQLMVVYSRFVQDNKIDA